ncbi:MAG: hypothetical protein M3Q22_03840 [Actinomycetota bacterium]|nr:hypothetical protein [Actinomycetota bacterium]
MTALAEPDTCPDGCYLPEQFRTRDRCDWCPALDRGPPAPEPMTPDRPDEGEPQP